MKVAFINVEKKTVEEIEVVDIDSDDSLEEWYKLLECDCVGTFYLYHLGGHGDDDLMFIYDDEGLLKSSPKYYQLPECNPVAGNSIIYCADPETGEACDWDGDIDKLRSQVTFL